MFFNFFVIFGEISVVQLLYSAIFHGTLISSHKRKSNTPVCLVYSLTYLQSHNIYLFILIFSVQYILTMSYIWWTTVNNITSIPFKMKIQRIFARNVKLQCKLNDIIIIINNNVKQLLTQLIIITSAQKWFQFTNMHSYVVSLHVEHECHSSRMKCLHSLGFAWNTRPNNRINVRIL